MAKRAERPAKPKRAKAQPDEFDRFESLTKALVSVPKEEIDKKRERDEAKRSRK